MRIRLLEQTFMTDKHATGTLFPAQCQKQWKCFCCQIISFYCCSTKEKVDAAHFKLHALTPGFHSDYHTATICELFLCKFFFSNHPVTSDTAMCLEYGAITRPVTTLNETFHHMLHERAVLRAVLTDAPSMMNKCVLEWLDRSSP